MIQTPAKLIQTPILIPVNLVQKTKMFISVKLLRKHVIIIYALGSLHEKFGVWIKAVPKSPKATFPAGPSEKNG